MTFRELYMSRKSVRAFSGRGITEAELTALLEAGIRAPNACNRQSWRFIVVTDPAVRAEFAAQSICAPWAADAPVIFVLCADATWLKERFGERSEKFVLQDTALAAENMLLAAAEMGLGGCIMGAFDESKCRALLDIPPHWSVHMLLPMGEAANAIPDRGRGSLADVVTFVGDHAGISAEERNVPFVLRGTVLKDARFEDANLAGAVFENVSLRNAKLNNINLHAAAYSDINMSDASFGGMRFDGSSFGCVGMERTTFTNVDFTDASFANCTFSGAKIDGVDVAKAIEFYKAHHPDA